MDSKKLKTLNCSACGGDLEIMNPRTKFVTCQYCGTTSDLSGVVKSQKKGNPADFLQRSFLKIGAIGKFEGIAYKIIGRTCWHSDYYEYDSEDKKYYKEKWDSDEWTLLSDEGTYKTIIEDDESYRIAETTIPQFPSLPENNKITLYDAEDSIQVDEYGESTIRYFEGESTYAIQIGDYSKYALYYKNKRTSIVEWRLNETNEIKEIEFFHETAISKKDLQVAFDIKKTERKKEKKKPKPEIIRVKEAQIILFIFLSFSVLNFVLAYYFDSKHTDDEALTTQLIQINKGHWFDLDDSSFVATGDFAETMEIPKESIIISDSTEVVMSISDEFEMNCFLYFLNEQNDTVAAYSNFFYYYSDTDSVAETTKLASNLENLTYFSSEGISGNIHLAIRYEMPKRFIETVEGMRIKYKFHKRGNNYLEGALYPFVLGVLLLFAGFLFYFYVIGDVEEN